MSRGATDSSEVMRTASCCCVGSRFRDSGAEAGGAAPTLKVAVDVSEASRMYDPPPPPPLPRSAAPDLDVRFGSVNVQ
jgi:hypothetical protein